MEAPMTQRTIKHEIKLQKSVIVILGILAVGVFANAFGPTFGIKDAMAQTVFPSQLGVSISGSLGCDYGCQ
jgi:hypothetical protein